MTSPKTIKLPEFRLQRPSVDDSDYFSHRPVQRIPFTRATSDTFVEAMTAIRRGTPFDGARESLELPRFSPSLPGVEGPQNRRMSLPVQAWRNLSPKQQTTALLCLAGTLVCFVSLVAGFVLGMYVALNHLDLHPRRRDF